MSTDDTSAATSPMVELLARVPLFAGLSQAQLGAVQRILRPRAWQPGEVILREDETGHTMYILVSGTVQVSKKLSMGRAGEEMEKSLVRLDAHRPEMFGEAGLLNSGVRSATVTAVRPCQAYEIAKADFLKLCESDPALGYRTLWNLAQILESRLRRTNQDVLKLATALSIALGH